MVRRGCLGDLDRGSGISDHVGCDSIFGKGQAMKPLAGEPQPKSEWPLPDPTPKPTAGRNQHTPKLTSDERLKRLIPRFWSKVEVGSDEECWLWRASRNSTNYGEFWVGDSFPEARRNGIMGAHKVAFLLAVGPIGEGLCVCHTCDNPSCCNPAHLFLATRAENQADMRDKGRAAKGERVANSRLTGRQVQEIKSRLESGEFPRQLAEDFGVSESTIRHVRGGKTWTHIHAISQEHAE